MKPDNILAVDYGQKKIGLAFKSKNSLYIKPLGNFKNEGDLIKKFVDLIKLKKITLVIFGHPLKVNDKKSPITIIVEDFTQKLKNSLPKNTRIELINEFYTTKETIYRLTLLGKSEKYIEQHKDTYSAVLILERYLNYE